MLQNKKVIYYLLTYIFSSKRKLRFHRPVSLKIDSTLPKILTYTISGEFDVFYIGKMFNEMIIC